MSPLLSGKGPEEKRKRWRMHPTHSIIRAGKSKATKLEILPEKFRRAETIFCGKFGSAKICGVAGRSEV
jgi:hypothetical protein